jgi:hypothetical protein
MVGRPALHHRGFSLFLGRRRQQQGAVGPVGRAAGRRQAAQGRHHRRPDHPLHLGQAQSLLHRAAPLFLCWPAHYLKKFHISYTPEKCFAMSTPMMLTSFMDASLCSGLRHLYLGTSMPLGASIPSVMALSRSSVCGPVTANAASRALPPPDSNSRGLAVPGSACDAAFAQLVFLDLAVLGRR